MLNGNKGTLTWAAFMGKAAVEFLVILPVLARLQK
jgi:hypothetical protein